MLYNANMLSMLNLLQNKIKTGAKTLPKRKITEQLITYKLVKDLVLI